MTRKRRSCSMGQVDDTEENEVEARYLRQQEHAEKYGEMMPDCAGEDVCENMVFVNAYSEDQVYGGPEEGGWYYDAGIPLASVPIRAKPAIRRSVYGENEYQLVPADQVEADRTVKQLEKLFSCLQNPRGRSSVIGGPDVEIRIEECPAKPFPARRPRYE